MNRGHQGGSGFSVLSKCWLSVATAEARACGGHAVESECELHEMSESFFE